MMSNNLRFVDDPENQNEGLTAEEIENLQEKSNLRFPKAYIYFLQNAGKKSNISHSSGGMLSGSQWAL